MTYDPLINLEKIQSKILAAGMILNLERQDDEAYNALPECCRYRDTDRKWPHAIQMRMAMNML